MFGKNSVAVTKNEYAELVEQYENYVDEIGVDFGFIKFLFNKLNQE